MYSVFVLEKDPSEISYERHVVSKFISSQRPANLSVKFGTKKQRNVRKESEKTENTESERANSAFFSFDMRVGSMCSASVFYYYSMIKIVDTEACT